MVRLTTTSTTHRYSRDGSGCTISVMSALFRERFGPTAFQADCNAELPEADEDSRSESLSTQQVPLCHLRGRRERAPRERVFRPIKSPALLPGPSQFSSESPPAYFFRKSSLFAATRS